MTVQAQAIRELVDPVDQQEDMDAAIKILQASGVPTEYHVLTDTRHYDVYGGRCLDEVPKLEVPWFDKYLTTG